MMFVSNRPFRLIVASACVVVAACSASTRLRADGVPADPGAPTNQHRVLDAFVGDFDQTTEIRLPSGEVVRAGATERGRWILGGRFVQVDSASRPGEKPAGERTVIYGYDPTARTYTLLTLDSSSLVATTAAGTYDPAARAFTFEGERAVGRDRAPFRWIMDVREPGRIEQAILVRGADGVFAEAIRVVHARKTRP